jgi:TetR/AcrR family transcriptional regulator, tetracycline repressor protein
MTQRTESKHREKLTRERVINTALRIMDEEGLDAVSMRRVGRELGVEAMSLYHHVRDKEDLLLGIREQVLSQFLDPGIEGDWEVRARQAARSWRHILRAHPNIMALISESKRFEMTPTSMRPTEAALRLLLEVGLPEDDAVKAYCALGGFIVGFVMFEIGVTRASGPEDQPPTPEGLMAALPADEFPCFMSSLPYLMQGDIDQRFEYGLDLLVAGIRSKSASVPSSSVSD